METKFIAVPRDLLIRVDSLLTYLWSRGGINDHIKDEETFEFAHIVANLRGFIKGKEQEICPICGDFLTRNHIHEV